MHGWVRRALSPWKLKGMQACRVATFPVKPMLAKLGRELQCTLPALVACAPRGGLTTTRGMSKLSSSNQPM